MGKTKLVCPKCHPNTKGVYTYYEGAVKSLPPQREERQDQSRIFVAHMKSDAGSYVKNEKKRAFEREHCWTQPPKY